MPQDDFDKGVHVISMFKVGGEPLIKYAHSKKEWKELNEAGYSDDMRMFPKMEWPKTMRMLGAPSTRAHDEAEEAKLRAQGWTTDHLPKGHNDPSVQIHAPANDKFASVKVQQLEQQLFEMAEQMKKLAAANETLALNQKRTKKKEDAA